ncbi:MAG: SpoIID/LytB domain-containing protein [Candidatus Eremiobacteraeota bacterium]|nr:SpoIID/LytB domain-containing protein [Candidatus Eremiobacteraeota bacterium]
MSLHRARFLGLTAATLALPRVAHAQSYADPATSAAAPALRVLLGNGEAVADPAGNGFTFNGRAFRGSFTRLPDGNVVNLVDLEQYLYAVVPHEMPPAWPPPALQAQAICARTYVLQRSNPARDYDLVPSEIDQVYAGIAGESPAGRMAVDATSGQVLRFANAYAGIAYSSCCGGHTEASSDAWGGAFVPYLGGVVCGFCTQSPNYRWNATLGLDDIAARFATQLVGTLRDVRITGIDASGRARGFELVADGGSTIVKGSTFRLRVGSRVMRSLLITKLETAQSLPMLAIEGGGLGHGVGLCQWGARGLAQSGRSARDILDCYFPGTALGRD